MASITIPNIYKKLEENLLVKAVDYLYENYISDNEANLIDIGELLYDFDENGLVEMILNEILNSNHKLWLQAGFSVKPEHLRTIGEERIKEIVSHRVEVKHTEDPWCWEN